MKILNQILLLIIILFGSIIAQIKDEIIEYNAATGKKYKIITTESFDPLTGNIIVKTDTILIPKYEGVKIKLNQQEMNPVNQQMVFDPYSGLELKSTDLAVISLARSTARQNYNKVPWVFLGGPTTCGTMIAGGTFGGMTFGAPGFLIGSVGFGILTPQLLSKAFVNQQIYYPSLIEQKEKSLYRESYLKEVQKQRQNSIYNGALFTCGATAIVLMLMLMGSMPFY